MCLLGFLVQIATLQVSPFSSALDFVFVSGTEDDSLGPCCLPRITPLWQ